MPCFYLWKDDKSFSESFSEPCIHTRANIYHARVLSPCYTKYFLSLPRDCNRVKEGKLFNSGLSALFGTKRNTVSLFNKTSLTARRSIYFQHKV